MDRPKPTGYVFPETLSDVPLPICKPGVLLQTNAGFRTIKPVIDSNKCVACMMCYLLCPEGTVYSDDKTLVIDYAYCKGCGICARECKLGAIEMISEG